MLVIAPAAQSAYTSTATYNHYSLLRSIEVAWDLPSLTSNDSSANVMTDFWC